MRTALTLDPNLAAAHVNLGNMLLRAADAREAIEHLRVALAQHSGMIFAHSNFLLARHYVSDFSREEVFEEHLKFGRFLNV